MENNKSYEIKRIVKYQTRLDRKKEEGVSYFIGACLLGVGAMFNFDEVFANYLVNLFAETDIVIKEDFGREISGVCLSILSGMNFGRALGKFEERKELKNIVSTISTEFNQTEEKQKQYIKKI